MDSPSSKRVAAVRRVRKSRRLTVERINEEGWRLLYVASESLQFDIRTTSSGGHAVLSRRDFSSSEDVFSTILSRELRILQTNPDHSLTTRRKEG